MIYNLRFNYHSINKPKEELSKIPRAKKIKQGQKDTPYFYQGSLFTSSSACKITSLVIGSAIFLRICNAAEKNFFNPQLVPSTAECVPTFTEYEFEDVIDLC